MLSFRRETVELRLGFGTYFQLEEEAAARLQVFRRDDGEPARTGNPSW